MGLFRNLELSPNVFKVIPAKSHANIALSFTPYPTAEVPKNMDCIGYMLGYMSLDNDKAIRQEGLVTRPQAYRYDSPSQASTVSEILGLTTVKLVLSAHSKKDKTKVLKTNGSLIKIESIAECSLGAFCNTFDLH